METIDVKVTDRTKEIYTLYRELGDFLKKVSGWYEKEFGCPENKDVNMKIMGDFCDKLTEAFSKGDSFIMELFKARVCETICDKDCIL